MNILKIIKYIHIMIITKNHFSCNDDNDNISKLTKKDIMDSYMKYEECDAVISIRRTRNSILINFFNYIKIKLIKLIKFYIS